MTLKDVAARLGWKLLTESSLEAEAATGFTSDLLSDVMGNAQSEAVFITIQSHKNTIAVASLAGLPAVLLCSNREAPSDMIAAAEKEDIALFQTPDNQFLASVRLGRLLGIE